MADNFIREFHNIEGKYIGERQKNLNTLLKNVSLSPEEKEFVLCNLKPKTYLENLFYIDVLIHLRETSRLLTIFQDGNSVFVSKIMKQPWFFQDAFKNTDTKTFVDECLPSLSFCMKIKLLRQLPLIYTEEKIDEIFDRVVNRYGLFFATNFLTDCSSKKIALILRENKINLSTHQLKLLYRKQPNLIHIYIEKQKEYKNQNILDNNFLTYIAQNNPIYFWELIEKYDMENYLKMGRRTTKKLIPTKKQELVNDPGKYIKYFRQETLVRQLNKQGDFVQLYHNAFPRNIDDVHSGALCNELLKYYPKSRQYDLFTKTFNDVTNKDIWQFSKCFQDSLLDRITDVSLRESWAQLKYKESNNEEYLKFYELKKAIPLIKERIHVTGSIRIRTRLLSLLVESCAKNKDLNALQEVLKYFCTRHRNDDSSTRLEFLQTIENNFNLEELNSTHWNYIYEILTIQSLKNEGGMNYFKLRIKHIEYMYNNNASEKDKTYYIMEYMEEQIKTYYFDCHVLSEISPEIQKILLLQTVEHIDSLIEKFKNEPGHDYIFLKSLLVGRILSFNIKHPQNKINIQENEKLMALLKHILKNKIISYEMSLVFRKVICKLNRNTIENELLHYFWGDKSIDPCYEKTIQWYLKYDIMEIVNNIDKIMGFKPPSKYIMNKIKKHNHLTLDNKVVKFCLEKLKGGENHEKSAYAEPLSILYTTEEYMKLMKDLNLIPKSSKLATGDAELKEIYQIQMYFLKSFRNLSEPLKYLQVLLDTFCQGDYLQGSLSSLYTAFYNIPENTLQNYLEILINNKAVSVKKHGLFLACCVFDRQRVLQISNKFQEDKNDSLLKCLLLTSLRYFINNPQPEHFEKLLHYMKFLKAHDIESLKVLISAIICKKYEPSYMTNIWNLLENLKSDGNAVGLNLLMSSVLENIDKDCVPHLSLDLCKCIINKYFATDPNSGDEISSIFQFVLKFLLYYENQTEHFNYIFKLLLNYKLRYFSDITEGEHKTVYNFFNEFFTFACDVQVDLDFVNKFSLEWQNVFTINETFKQYVLLHLLKFKKEAKEDFELYSKQIVLYAEQINDTYGQFVFSKFIPILANFYINADAGREIELLTNLLKYKTSVLNYIMVMELISINDDMFLNGTIKPQYHEINSLLKQINDPTVQLCYNLCLKK